METEKIYTFAFECRFEFDFALKGEETEITLRDRWDCLEKIKDILKDTFKTLGYQGDSDIFDIRSYLKRYRVPSSLKELEIFWQYCRPERFLLHIPDNGTENDVNWVVNKAARIMEQKLKPYIRQGTISISGTFVNRDPDIYWSTRFGNLDNNVTQENTCS